VRGATHVSVNEVARHPLATGDELYALATRLFPIGRSLTGDGVRRTLEILKEFLPNLRIHDVPTGARVFDWTIPKEWNVRSARLIDPDGQVIADYTENNLHIVGYSVPIDAVMSLEELQHHLHSRPDLPDAIPYVTSYYSRGWGICIPHKTRESLKPGQYHVQIDSSLEPGFLTYADLLLKGEIADEILISTYICHPSMANNELSGPVVATFLAQWLSRLPRRYTYRFVFVPETIGTLTYLQRNLKYLQQWMRAGFVVTCCGDPGRFSLMPSRSGATYADRLAQTVLLEHEPDYITYSFLQRGSDERQYCSPLIDLPVVSVMRSKYHEYPEYHTSLDDLSFITSKALHRTLKIYSEIVTAIEQNCVPRATTFGEPQLGQYGLYPQIGGQVDQSKVALSLDLLAYADGTSDLLEIAHKTGHSFTALRTASDLLVKNGLLVTVSPHERHRLRFSNAFRKGHPRGIRSFWRRSR